MPEAKAAPFELVDERIYTLPDLAQGVNRRFSDVQGVRLPKAIFRLITDVDTEQKVAMQKHLPPDFEDGLDDKARGLIEGQKVISASA